MWTAEHTETTTAGPQVVWQRWVDPQRWAEHNDQLAWARLEEPLALGARITLKPKAGPRSKVTITTLDPYRKFSTVGKLPGCRMTLDHEMNSRAGHTAFTHRVTMRGWSTPLFRRLFGNDLAASFATMQASIARLAEGE